MQWKTFLTLTGLVRYFVLFVIDLQTRRVQIGGVVRQPYGAWMRATRALSISRTAPNARGGGRRPGGELLAHAPAGPEVRAPLVATPAVRGLRSRGRSAE
jgi:hypothetical protein